MVIVRLLRLSFICIITTQADEFKSIDDNFIVHNPTTIIDCWRMLDSLKFIAKVKYIGIGMAVEGQSC